jgi:NAD(P)H-hydrate epimerase
LRSEGGLVYLTADEMAAADRAAIEDFGVDVLSLMENAGVGTARVARVMLGESVAGKKVCCLVGKGNNGGDGLVAARHLSNWGAKVSVVVSGGKGELRDVPLKQLRIIEAMRIPFVEPSAGMREADLIVDGLLGYGSRGDPREPVAGLIREANSSGVPILAVDIPSGLDATTGAPGDPCIEAKATATFGLPKTGFLNPKAKRFIGALYLVDISLPQGLYSGFAHGMDVFGQDTLVRVW